MGDRKRPTPAPETPDAGTPPPFSAGVAIKLGDRVKDRITGLIGIVTGYHYYLFGCERVSVQPESVGENGAIPDSIGIDAVQCELVRPGAIKGYNPLPGITDSRDLLARPAGPRRDDCRPADPTR